jgi:hypothetical protein
MPSAITAMDPNPRLQLANHIHLGLMRELGQGIDVRQMLGSPLYARDVLLVCSAYPGTKLQRLGEQFREATPELVARRAEHPSGWQRRSSGFGLSKPAARSSYPGFDEFVDSLPATRPPARRWLVPSTWFER